MTYRNTVVIIFCFALVCYGQAWSRPGANVQNHPGPLLNGSNVLANPNNTNPSVPDTMEPNASTTTPPTTTSTNVPLQPAVRETASTVTQHFSQLTHLITATSYIAGLGFVVGAILKFKTHKDNPIQTPIGTPISLVFIAAALLFLPSILNVTSYTIFGNSGGQITGPTGTTYTSGT